MILSDISISFVFSISLYGRQEDVLCVGVRVHWKIYVGNKKRKIH
jgi:hypothetical protein